jgi:uncharacterized lipoprotein YmbA
MKLRSFLFLALATALWSGCLSRIDQTRYYFLSTPAPVPSAAVDRGQVFLAGLRLTSAEYLRAKPMLVEVGDNQLRSSEDNVWQETPPAGFTRVLAGRFAQNLPNCQLTSMPSATTNQPEMVLEIELRSMQGRLQPRSEAEVSAELRILDASGRLLERDELRQTAPWNPTNAPDGYAALASAESRAAAALADEIGEKALARHRKISGR